MCGRGSAGRGCSSPAARGWFPNRGWAPCSPGAEPCRVGGVGWRPCRSGRQLAPRSGTRPSAAAPQGRDLGLVLLCWVRTAPWAEWRRAVLKAKVHGCRRECFSFVHGSWQHRSESCVNVLKANTFSPPWAVRNSRLTQKLHLKQSPPTNSVLTRQFSP